MILNNSLLVLVLKNVSLCETSLFVLTHKCDSHCLRYFSSPCTVFLSSVLCFCAEEKLVVVTHSYFFKS